MCSECRTNRLIQSRCWNPSAVQEKINFFNSFNKTCYYRFLIWQKEYIYIHTYRKNIIITCILPVLSKSNKLGCSSAILLLSETTSQCCTFKTTPVGRSYRSKSAIVSHDYITSGTAELPECTGSQALSRQLKWTKCIQYCPKIENGCHDSEARGVWGQFWSPLPASDRLFSLG